MREDAQDVVEPALVSAGALLGLIGAFERIELSPRTLGHRLRLALGAWYLLEREERDAVRRYLETLSKYQLISTNLPGELRYHETRTLFWLSVTRSALRTIDTRDRVAAVRSVLERYGAQAKLIQRHYSADLFNSWRAVYGWVEPDLKPLPATA